MQSLYVAGTGAGTGKSAVILGVMEMLSAVNRKVGFFRPVVRRSVDDDNLISLMRSRYDVPFAPEMLYGCTAATAQQLVGSGCYDELLKRILIKFKRLEESCDLVIPTDEELEIARQALGVVAFSRTGFEPEREKQRSRPKKGERGGNQGGVDGSRS